MSVLGSYYQWEQNAPINGLGRTDPEFEMGMGEQALVEILKAASRKAPPVLTPWGKQSGDVSWNDVAPQWNLQVFPLTEAQLQKAQQTGQGTPVGWVAILTASPVKQQTAEAVFEGTPYEMVEAMGGYWQADKLPVPRIFFLYWARARDIADRGLGRGSLQSVATRLGGQLVFPLRRPRGAGDRAHPSTPFSAALNAQLTPAGLIVNGRPPGLPPPGGARPRPGSASVPASEARSTAANWLLVGSVAAAAGAVGYAVVVGSRKRGARAA